MAKGLFAGTTDYSHQSFTDIIDDLQKEVNNVTGFIEAIESSIAKVKETSYWDKTVDYDFRNIIYYSLKHYKTSKEEMTSISKEIEIEVRENHCKRLFRIAKVADEINKEIGKIWHQSYTDKDYDNLEFKVVERIYGDTRDMAVNLLDISNIAVRLEDFIGKTSINMDKKNQRMDGILNSSFGDNTTIIVGDNNSVKSINIKSGNFEDLREVLKRNNVSDEDISELKEIVEKEKPDIENKKLGDKTNGWISKMVNKCLQGTWQIGIGAAGKLLADAIKLYYGVQS